MGVVRGECRASMRRAAVVGTLLSASFLLAVGVVIRVERTGSNDTIALVWNLFLAWIPFVLALVVYDRVRRVGVGVVALLSGGLWLLFLPNAPYIVTDGIWLDDWRYSAVSPHVPAWYDLGLYVVAAGTGAVLGFASLYLVQRTVARAGGELAGWALAVGALALSGVGVYLGRVLRWNSWDLFTRPEALLADVASGLADPFAYPSALAPTVACAIALLGGYALFYAALRRQLRHLVES